MHCVSIRGILKKRILRLGLWTPYISESGYCSYLARSGQWWGRSPCYYYLRPTIRRIRRAIWTRWFYSQSRLDKKVPQVMQRRARREISAKGMGEPFQLLLIIILASGLDPTRDGLGWYSCLSWAAKSIHFTKASSPRMVWWWNLRPLYVSEGSWSWLVTWRSSGPMRLSILNLMAYRQIGLSRPKREDRTSLEFPITLESMVHQATDARDRIFALYNLEPILTPDYHMATWDVYCEFSKRYTLRFCNLGILRYSGVGLGIPSQLALPSWVPDFDSFSKAKIPFTLPPTNAENSTIRNRCEDKFYCMSISDSFHLNVSGVIIDSISKLEADYDTVTDGFLEYYWEFATLLPECTT